MPQPDPPPSNFSEYADFIAPTFLLGPNLGRYRFAMSLQWDALGDAASYAVRERFPLTCGDDALPYLQQDRQIDRGPNEPRPSYQQRLIEWLDLWRVAGGAPSVLRALSSYFLPGSADIETVNDTTEDDLTAWNTNATDPPTHIVANPGNWNWDDTRVPGRAWVIIYNGPWAQSVTWGGGQRWGDGWCYGFNGNVDVAQTLRMLVGKWKAAGCSVPFIIIAFDPSWFVPTLPPGSPLLPDGTWGDAWKVITVGGERIYVQSRTETAIYIDGVP
jgi:hypothetical protein